jgi:2-isopropylmalate synthase
MPMLRKFKEMAKGKLKEHILNHRRRQNSVHFSDTTLRDGEQMPGASLTIDGKVAIAKGLAEMGVDSLDAGFPAAAESEILAMRRIVREVKGPVITGLCRMRKSDIDAAYEALEEASIFKRGVSLFIATSPIHREDKLHKSKNEIIDIIGEHIQYAREKFEIVSFGAEDASRTELSYLVEVYTNAIDAGATSVGLPDTLGIMTPEKVKYTLDYLRDNVHNNEKALHAVHFHNDYGLGTANALAAISSGVDIVQGTINGLGERAGNTALEEVIMAIVMNQTQYKKKVYVDTTKLVPMSRMVAELTGIPVTKNKPVVGETIFQTAAGIHQDGLMKNPDTYLPFMPEKVGAEKIEIIMGKHSGKAAFDARLRKIGFELGQEELAQLMRQVVDAPKAAWEDPDKLLRETAEAIRAGNA